MIATYRLQLTPDFNFDHARQIIPFLRTLGISHLYLSPIFEARHGSTHGYDVTDPTRIRAELGGETAFRRLAEDARAAGLGVLLDIVPNHMAADPANPWWWDVLKRGCESDYAPFFDVQWNEADGRIVLPILRQPLDAVIEARELTVGRGSPHDEDEPVIRYLDRTLPIRPVADRSREEQPVRSVQANQAYRLMFWREGLRQLNYRRFFDMSDLVAVRVEEPAVFEATHARLLGLIGDGLITSVRIDHIDGLHDPFAYLHRLRAQLDARRPPETADQERLIFVEKILTGDEKLPDDWPVAGTTGYEFANETSRLLVQPEGFRALELHAADRGACRDWVPRAPGMTRFAYTLLQAKGLVCEELFPAEVTRLVKLLAKVAEAQDRVTPPRRALEQAIVAVTEGLSVYRTYIDERGVRQEDAARLDHTIACAHTELAEHLSDHEPALQLMRFALLEGVRAEGRELRDACLSFVTAWQKLTGAVMAKGGEDTALYQHVVLTSLNEVGGEPVMPEDPVAAFHRANAHRAERWPATLNATATHDTKRGEDTRARIAVLSELAEQWTDALDRWIKRHEPLRRRVDGSASPSPADEILIYQSLLGIVSPICLFPSSVPSIAGVSSPTSTDSGFWDSFGNAVIKRLEDYLIKAAREAKARTNWYEPHEDYEQALREFIRQLFESADSAAFREDFVPLARTVAFHGALNSLTQLILKITSPGCPDIYRGTELWDLTLVDPDNRQPVDYAQREELMHSLPHADGPASGPELQDLRDHWTDGRIKLFITRQGLALRRSLPDVFCRGAYVPLSAEGARASHVCAFARRNGPHWVIVTAARLTASLVDTPGTWPLGESGWCDTRVILPEDAPRAWIDSITGLPWRDLSNEAPALPLAVLFTHLPLTLLSNDVAPGPDN